MTDPINPGKEASLSDINVIAEQSRITAQIARGMIRDISNAQKKNEFKGRVNKARRIIKEVQEQHAAGKDVSLETINKALKEIDVINDEAREILHKQIIEEEKRANKNTIQSIRGNTEGDDLVIGDVHGQSECLKAVLDTLKEKDRLFLVGDLTDRGKDSLGVIQLLSEKQYANKIFAVRGNHEDLCVAGIAALEKRCINGGSKELLDNDNEYIEYISDKSKKNDFRNKYQKEPAIFDMSRNGGGWLITLFNEELASAKITVSDGVIKYSEDSQIKMVKEYMAGLPYIMYVQGDKPFNVVHADMPINDKELAERIKNKLGLTKAEKRYATWAREGGLTDAIQDTGRTETSIPTYVGHSIVADGNVPPVRTNTNTIDIDVGSYATNVSLVVNVTQGKCEYIGNGSSKAYGDDKLVGVINTVNKHLKPNNKRIEIRMTGGILSDQYAEMIKGKSQQAVNQVIIDTPNSIYENCKNGKLASIDQRAVPTLDLAFNSANLERDIGGLSDHIATLREQDFDNVCFDKVGKKILVKYHAQENDIPEEFNPIHCNEAEVQAMRYLRGMLLIAKHTADNNTQQLLLKEMNEKYEQYKASSNRPSADLTHWLSDQFAASIYQHLGVKKMDAARKQLTMARDLGILLENHPTVCTLSESEDQVTVETSTPYKVSKEYYENQELFQDISGQHWFMNAKKLAGFGINAQDTWMQKFFESSDFTQVKENGVAVPPSARWLPIPANNQVVEMCVAAKNGVISEMEFSRTRVMRTGVAIPYDVRKLKWWKSADAEQKKIAKVKLRELMEHQLDERIKEYKELYGGLMGTNGIAFYANYQTLLSPLKIIDDWGGHVDNNKKFIGLIKEVMKEIDADKNFKAKYEVMGVNLKVRHTNAAVNRNAGKKILGKKITTTYEYSEDEKTRREKIAEFDEVKDLIKQAVLPSNVKKFNIADLHIQNLMKTAGYQGGLIKELVQRERACQCLQNLLDNKEPYNHLDRYQRNIMMAALEHLAMGSQSLTLVGCKSARDRTGIVLCAIKTMQENPDAMTQWDVLNKGIVKSLQQGHAFRSMIFHSAIVKVSLVHQQFMGKLASNIQKDIGELLIFSRKPPKYDASKAQSMTIKGVDDYWISAAKNISHFLQMIRTSELTVEKKHEAISQLNIVLGIFNAIKKELNLPVNEDKSKINITQVQKAVEQFNRVLEGILAGQGLQSNQSNMASVRAPYSYHDYVREYGDKHPDIKHAHDGFFHHGKHPVSVNQDTVGNNPNKQPK